LPFRGEEEEKQGNLKGERPHPIGFRVVGKVVEGGNPSVSFALIEEIIEEMKGNGIYGPISTSRGNNSDERPCNVSLDSIDLMITLYKLTAMTWTHGKVGKYGSGGLVFRYRRLQALAGKQTCMQVDHLFFEQTKCRRVKRVKPTTPPTAPPLSPSRTAARGPRCTEKRALAAPQATVKFKGSSAWRTCCMPRSIPD
jgi:hypothetical protein